MIVFQKVQNLLNSQFDIGIRFRGYEQGVVFDISKAYNRMSTGIVERNLRRLVWRFTENDPWTEYFIDKVHFGDRPASVLLELGKHLTADLGK